MADPIDVAASIREIKARTGLSWREVGDLLGTTGEYARKLATKTTSSGAGRALAGNVADFLATGAQQNPVQRAQRVRQAGGAPSAAAAPRARVTGAGQFKVERSVFRGATRDGWAVNVTAPTRASKTGDREDARHAIMDATRRAAQGRRRVEFRVTVKDGHGGQRVVTVGGKGGYDAKRALRGMRSEGNDPFPFLAAQGLSHYSDMDDEPDEADILAVEVIGLP